jgi:hypothetical protein
MPQPTRQARNGPPPDTPTPTKRVVLKREKVVVLAVNTDGTEDKAKEAIKLLGGKLTDAWVVVAEVEGASKEHAIEAHAGKPNTAEAKTGIFKAPTASAWSGGRRYAAPPKPLVQAEAID